MVLLLPLIFTTGATRFLARQLVQRGFTRATPWDSWPAAAALGMSAVYISTGITHFIEPQRSGLVAIVPNFVPWPELAVTASGFAEFAIALALALPRTRRWAALASIALLLVLFPANVVAAGGVDNPAAPTTALAPRALLQLTFLGFSALAFYRVQSRAFHFARVKP